MSFEKNLRNLCYQMYQNKDMHFDSYAAVDPKFPVWNNPLSNAPVAAFF